MYSAKANKYEISEHDISLSEKTSWMFDLFATVIGAKTVSEARVVTASLLGPSPHEGLALVESYMKISDPSVRQALLDLTSLLAASDI